MNQRKRKNFGLWICLIAECLILAFLVSGCIFLNILARSTQSQAQEQTVQQNTQATQTTERPTEATTVPAEETIEETRESTRPLPQPGELTACLQRARTDYDALQAAGCTQLVVVSAKGTWAQIQYYRYTAGVWEEQPALKCEGYVGAGGVSDQKREGDGATPAGLYPIEEAFYIRQLPQTGLDAFQITQDTYWVDDPNSAFYNQRVEGTAEKDWASAEHMISYPQYRCGFVVGYNMPVQPAAGSAIFFHIGSSATAGCIATTETMVLAYLKELDKACSPHILILN